MTEKGPERARLPPPLPEAERRAWLEAMGIPLWLPRQPVLPASGGLEGEAEARADAPPGSTPPAAGVAAMDWSELRATVLACRECGLCATRTQAVFGVGSRAADLLVIGEAPGQDEDREGEPFVGRAGQLLDRMLAAIDLDRTTVYITNVLKCRPPQNRDPHMDEARACAPYLRRQIELMNPRVILAVGRISAQQLLETDEAIGGLRQRWHQYGPQATPLRVTYHPAYLLRKPVEKAKSWEDLKCVRDALAGAA